MAAAEIHRTAVNAQSLFGSTDSPAPAPAPARHVEPPAANPAAFDDLFDYDAAMDDMFRDVDTDMTAPAPKPSGAARRAGDTEDGVAGGLGIDEEIQVTKKKRVTVKMDENRLLSQNGIPKLRRIAKERLRFKGKGHEYSDVGRLLSLYQLWLDDLYPKAKFADGLAMIEKLGHSRRLQAMRREWIDEERMPPSSDLDLDLDTEPVPPGPTNALTAGVANAQEAAPAPVDDLGPSTPLVHPADADDLYTATPGRRTQTAVVPQEPDDDELDALFGNELAREAIDNGPAGAVDRVEVPSISQGLVDDDFGDEMEAMADLEELYDGLLHVRSDLGDPDETVKMADRLSAALEKVRLGASAGEGTEDNLIDQILHEHRARAREPRSQDQLRKELQDRFLTPSPSFSTEWLNKLQQRWDAPPDYTDLFALAPTQTRTITRFTRAGLEGRVTGYREITVPASSATAKNSTSLLRRPANRADFVRGAAGFYPFAPGGLDDVEATAAFEDASSQSRHDRPEGKASASLDRLISFGSDGGLLEIPPGFSRGLAVQPTPARTGQDDAKELELTLTEPAAEAVGGPSAEGAAGAASEDGPGSQEATASSDEDADGEGDDEIDAMLPVEYPALAPRGPLTGSTARRAGREWAHMIDVNRDITNFRDLVPDMAREWPFELDTFQKEAVYHLERGDSVFVAAHTSAGKTVVAEYAIALAAKHMTKAIYTSPIKALSNQKFRDFRQTFDDVGILTGDIQIRPEASCLIMTTEILRSMLYRGADLIREVEYVIFDEVHYVNDLERGVVWEEVIIMLPDHVTLILLSATVPNTYEFASWVGRTKKKDIYVISTPKRPVPLEHYLWANKAMYKIVDADKKFLEKGWKAANDVLSGRDKVKDAPEVSVVEGADQINVEGADQIYVEDRRGADRREEVGQLVGVVRLPVEEVAVDRRGDRNIWVHLVQHLRKEDLLPACIFVFSKRRCEENADALSNLDYCTASEKSAIHMIVGKSIARLRPEDRVLPQIRRMRELLGRGIAVHHGGLLPIVKEVVEILFARTLVKVLFATETFAMGLNLPTRTVVFSGFRKHDGRSFRDLLPGEYTQMAGRAGRRGLDTVGSVIIVAPGADEAPPVATLRSMILGDPTKLRSQFRLTYNMILNLLRVEALKIEEMIKRSFSEHATQALLPRHEKQVKLSEADLAKDGVRAAGILVKEGPLKGLQPALQVLEIDSGRTKRETSDLLPYLPAFRALFGPPAAEEMKFKVASVSLTDVECVTRTIVKMDLTGMRKNDSLAVQEVEDDVTRLCSSWMTPEWDELDWTKVKDLQLRNILDERAQEAIRASTGECLSCPQFLKHFAMQHDEWLIKENISQLRQLMSDQNLQLLPDYEQRLQVLKDLGFIDDSSRVLLKGKVACEIHSADELVLTELVLENVLAEFEAEEIVALLSAFVFQEKTEQTPTLTARLEKVGMAGRKIRTPTARLITTAQGKQTIIQMSERVNAVQTQHQVILSSDDSNDFVSRPRFGLVEVVYEWARGMSFNRITDLTDVLEGTIVRVINRLDETCREVKNAARIIGDPTLFLKMQECQEMIKRDITAVASLYM
ncbi:MAG: hypothetical protein M1838_004113 [Thelocarpon superellum]|nr:MAG: hypothetical protein M1838_004113 [Thelocarpon superellum]